MLLSAPDAPIRAVFLSYSLRCLGCSNPGRLLIVFSPLLQSVAPGSPPDDPVRGLVPCFFQPGMLQSGASFYRILSVASDAPVCGAGLAPGRSSPGAIALLHASPDAPIRGVIFIVFSPLPRTLQSAAPGSPPDDPVRGLVPCFFPPWMLQSGPFFYRILSVASDAPVRGTGFTPGRSSPEASAVLLSAPDVPIRGVFLSYSLRCLGRSSPWHRVRPRTIKSGGYCLASCRPGCSNPGRLFITFSPLPRTLQSVAPGSPPDDPVRGLAPCFFPPRMPGSGPSFYRILSVASDAQVRGTGFTPGRSSPGASAVLLSSPDAPIRGVFLSFCRTLAAASDAPVRGARFTPGRPSPGARAVLSLAPDAPTRDVMLASVFACAVLRYFVFFFRAPIVVAPPPLPRSTLLSPPFPLPLRPGSSLPLLPVSPFVVALLGQALKLLVPTRACCYVLGREHTFILLLPFLPAFCSRALFLFSSRPLSHSLCAAFAYLLSSPLLFVWGKHTSSYSYACSLPPFSSPIHSFVLHSCRTPLMCVTSCRHRVERRGELATCIPANGVRFP